MNQTLTRLGAVAAVLTLAAAVATFAAQADPGDRHATASDSGQQRTDGDEALGAATPGSEGGLPGDVLYEHGKKPAGDGGSPLPPGTLTPEEQARLDGGYNGAADVDPEPGLAPSAEGRGPAEATDLPLYETVEGRPNIESVEVVSRDSYPPQWSVTVVSGGYNSCVSHLEDRVTREGNELRIEVVSLEPAPGVVVPCTRVYGIHTSHIDLEGEFEQGVEYVVFVNGERAATFSW